MTNGWDDPNGSERLLCNFVGDDNMITNVFAGVINEGSVLSSYASYTLGTSDFSEEFWWKWSGVEADDDNPWLFYRFIVPVVGAIPFWKVTSEVRLTFPGTAADIQTGTMPTANAWTHVAVNCDRSSNMELFFDGVSQGTGDISAAVATSIAAGDVGVPLVNSTELALATDVTIGLFGPAAIHNRLLTANEIKTSIDFKCVNDFGSSITIARYNWGVEEETGWEVRYDHGSSGGFGGVGGFIQLLGGYVAEPVTYVSPTGVNGTVVVRDRSGNNRHFYPPTAATYGTTFADWFQSAFAIDRGFER